MHEETFRCRACGAKYTATVADPPFELPEGYPEPRCPTCYPFPDVKTGQVPVPIANRMLYARVRRRKVVSRWF